MQNASIYAVRGYPPITQNLWAILDLTLKEWVTTGSGSAAMVRTWAGSDKAAAVAEAMALTAGTRACTGTKPIATPVSPATKAHLFGLGWNATTRKPTGGHHAPSILSIHPTFAVPGSGTAYVVYIVQYDAANPKSSIYDSSIQLLLPGSLLPTPGNPLLAGNSALFCQKDTSTLFPDTWNQNQITDAIKESLRDAWVNDKARGTTFEGNGGGIKIKGLLAKTTSGSVYIDTAYPTV